MTQAPDEPVLPEVTTDEQDVGWGYREPADDVGVQRGQ